MREFPVSLDGPAKVITALVVALLAGMPVISQNIVVAVISGAILLVTYAFAPRGYAVAEGSIMVRRLAGEVRIPLQGVRKVRRAEPGDLRRAIRLWASGGVFGYYGLFRSGLGTARWYVTDRKKAVIVEGALETVVLSPDNVEGFLATVAPYAPDVPPPAPAEHASKKLPLLAWVGIGVGVVAAGLGVLALVYAPGPPRYTLTSDSLTIHDRLYPVTVRAEAVDVGAIRVVDPAVEPRWRITARTNGFANSHYSAGWFRVAGGEKVRMYRARGTQLVLLPPKGEGTPVLYGSPEPERFITEVRRAWGQG